MKYNYILKHALIYDGSSSEPYTADIGIINDKIVDIGDDLTDGEIIDVSGLVVAPGFINMLSWSVESLIEDGRALSTIMQGVTLEVMGEGFSWGPINEYIKQELPNMFTSKNEYEITWNTLGEYLQYLEDKGISTNVASFLGSATVRMYYLKQENRAPTADELLQMQQLVAEAMEEGAMGLSSALIYPPNSFATTEELIALTNIVKQYNGMYISHIRSEGQNIAAGLDELIRIAEETNVHAEIYHFKVAGKSNWHKMPAMIKKINQARAKGLHITTDCYLYTAAGTGLDSCIPPFDGGRDNLVTSLKNPKIREKIRSQMLEKSKNWENLFAEAGPENIYPMVFKNKQFDQYVGKSIQEIAYLQAKDPRDVVIDLLIDDYSRIDTVYHIMSEENIAKKVALPYMSFGSDAESVAPEGKVLEESTHPRAYGNFARLIAKYVREEKIISLQEAIRKLSALPAENLKIKQRGKIQKGYYADLVVFDFEKVHDKATYDNPHQLAEGMHHVFVNGIPVLLNSKHTGNTPGRFIKGPGYKK